MYRYILVRPTQTGVRTYSIHYYERNPGFSAETLELLDQVHNRRPNDVHLTSQAATMLANFDEQFGAYEDPIEEYYEPVEYESGISLKIIYILA